MPCTSLLRKATLRAMIERRVSGMFFGMRREKSQSKYFFNFRLLSARGVRLEQNSEKGGVSLGFLLKLIVPFALAYFMSCLLRSINNVLAPIFIQTFSMSATDLGVMTSSYFLSFALAQIPLGLCLDRYSPGRTLAGLLCFGVIGCAVFAFAQTTGYLFIGRALVGLGVSGCLMSSFKAFEDWLPKNKLPMYNSLLSFIGGVGGLVATTPINAALGFMSWRMVFIILGVLTLLIAALVYFSPRHPDTVNDGSGIVLQLKGTIKIATTGRFWRLAPMAVMAQASYLALNSLWIGPWYRDVAGYPSSAIPNLLFVCACALTLGALTNGFVAIRLKARYGTRAIQITIVSMVIYTAVLGLILLFPQFGTILWPLFVFWGPFSLLTYPIFSSMYDKALSGRVLTTYNMLVFIVSTILQTTIGGIIDMFRPLADGRYNPQGYRVALGLIFALLALSIIWVILYRRKKDEITY